MYMCKWYFYFIYNKYKFWQARCEEFVFFVLKNSNPDLFLSIGFESSRFWWVRSGWPQNGPETFPEKYLDALSFVVVQLLFERSICVYCWGDVLIQRLLQPLKNEYLVQLYRATTLQNLCTRGTRAASTARAEPARSGWPRTTGRTGRTTPRKGHICFFLK